MMRRVSIAAVLVNHNTSAFAELAVRSLFVQNPGLDMTLTVYDNGSTDDCGGLLAAADTYGVRVVQSGFPISTPGNSHGEVLRRFVLDPANREADQFLFLDADVCFTQPGTINTLSDTLSNHPDAFGVGPRMSWDGQSALPTEVSNNPAIYANRLHPCCALVCNTAVFRSVA
jgi:GT2 family glycosyltransferase